MNIRTVKQFTKHTSKAVRDLANEVLRLTDECKRLSEALASIGDNVAEDYYEPDVNLELIRLHPEQYWFNPKTGRNELYQEYEAADLTHRLELVVHDQVADYQTFRAWKDLGRVVVQGERSHKRNELGEAVFHVGQTTTVIKPPVHPNCRTSLGVAMGWQDHEDVDDHMMDAASYLHFEDQF
jgi:hypothetical protein